MKKNILPVLVIYLLSSILVLASDTKIRINNNEIQPGKIVVKFHRSNGVDAASSALMSSIMSAYNVTGAREALPNARNGKVSRVLNLKNIYILDIGESTDIEQMINDLTGHPGIEYAEPVYKCYAEATVDDPRYGEQPHLPQIQVPDAWDIKMGSHDVIVGIVDTGVDWDHEDLAEIIWSNADEIPDNGIDDDGNGYVDDIRGWDFVDAPGGIDPHEDEDSMDVDNDPTDFNGHGTHCAGIAGAITNNATGVASASGGATIMPLRIGIHTSEGRGTGYSSWMAEAFIYAVDNGADILNLSFGNSGQMIVDAAYYALLNGVLVCESAGNGNAITPSALGSLDYVLSVAAVDVNDQRATYSSYGRYVEISAPGGDLNAGLSGILSSVPYPNPFYNGQKYDSFQGTSMASPLVASLAALIKSNEPEIGVLELFTRIVETADDIELLNPEYVNQLGSGRINALRALTESPEPKPELTVTSVEIDDAAQGNGNGVIDPGESFTAKFTVLNKWADAEGLSAVLSLSDEWPLSLETTTYNIGSLPGILNIENSTAVIEVPMTCSEDAIPLQVKTYFNFTVAGSVQSVEYPLGIQPSVLLVADFEETGGTELDFSNDYTDALSANKIAFDYIHHLDNEITPELLGKYKTVIWGCEWVFPGVDSSDRVAIKSFLDNGGSFFISGQDVGWELNESEDNADIDFYENYLKTRYLSDDAGVNSIFGVTDDPITNKISFDFFQRYRADDEQFPDILEPLEGSTSILNYANGKSGAIKHDGEYRLVNFGFGGFESITNPEIRSEIMGNIVRWLSGLNLSIHPLPDTENSTDDYSVSLSLSSSKSGISQATLYWDVDGQLPFNAVDLTSSDGLNYEGMIPTQVEGTTVQYFVYAEDDESNHILSETYSFEVGTDTEPPFIALTSPKVLNSINVFGPAPYKFTVNAYDNIGVDPENAFVNYGVNDEPMVSDLLNYVGNDIYEGTFSFREALSVGDRINYFFSVRDSSSSAHYAATDTFHYFIDTTQLIDDFENGLSYWNLDVYWDSSKTSNQGLNSIAFEPPETAPDSLNSAITYKIPLSLSPYAMAELEFYLKSTMERNIDSLFVEVSNDDGNTWHKVFDLSKVSFSFRKNTVDLVDYTGEGNDAVLVRFRAQMLKGDSPDIVWLDDISIIVSETPVTGVEDEYVLPADFALEQNYPNPFNPSTKIKFSLPVDSNVKIAIFNVLGQRVALLTDTEYKAGNHTISFNSASAGKTLSSGIYFYSIDAEGVNSSKFRETRKMLLLK